jgi:hypothetical protein
MRLALTYLDGDPNTLPFLEKFENEWSKYKKKSFRKEFNSLFKSKGKKAFCKKLDKLSENYFKEISKNTKRDYVLFDISPMDFLGVLMAYNKLSASLVIQGVLSEEELLSDEYITAKITAKITSIRQWSHYFDIIFYFPLSKSSNNLDVSNNYTVLQVEHCKALIDTNRIYNTEEFFAAPNDDKAAWIEVCGNPDIQLEHVKLYLNPDGDIWGEENNLITQHMGEVEEFKIDKDGFVVGLDVDDIKGLDNNFR